MTRQQITNRIWNAIKADEDLMLAIAAGCEIETVSQLTPAGLRFTIRTKNPIGIVDVGDGTKRVFEQRPPATG